MQFRVPRGIFEAGEWLALMPLWRKWIRPPGGRVAAAMATGAAWLVFVLALAGTLGGGEDSSDNGRRAAAEGSETRPERTARPTRTVASSPIPSTVVSATPEPTATPEAAPTASTGPAAAGASPGGATPGGTAGGTAPPAPTAPLVIVSSSSYTDSDGTLHVAGETRNTTPEYLDYVEITGTFFDASGQAVASEYTFTHVDLVGPGDTAGFDLGLANGAGLGVSRYELAVRGEVSADRPAPGLVITAESSDIDADGDFHVVGIAANQSAVAAEFITVAGTFYAADGTVVRSDFTYVDAEVLQPGESATFDLVLPEGGGAAIVRYQLRLEGFPA